MYGTLSDAIGHYCATLGVDDDGEEGAGIGSEAFGFGGFGFGGFGSGDGSGSGSGGQLDMARFEDALEEEERRAA